MQIHKQGRKCDPARASLTELPAAVRRFQLHHNSIVSVLLFCKLHIMFLCFHTRSENVLYNINIQCISQLSITTVANCNKHQPQVTLSVLRASYAQHVCVSDRGHCV